MATNGHGYDSDRDRWSRRATEALFPEIAQNIFNTTPKNIIYTWDSDLLDRLDKHYGVDALLQSSKRNTALAIRIRSNEYYRKFGDVTIRLDSLQTMGKKLEMQKSIARYMFYAWGDTDKPIAPARLVDWHVIWLQRLVDLYLKGTLPFNGPFKNGDESSRLVGFDVATLKSKGLIYTSHKQPEAVEQLDLFDRNIYYREGW